MWKVNSDGLPPESENNSAGSRNAEEKLVREDDFELEVSSTASVLSALER